MNRYEKYKIILLNIFIFIFVISMFNRELLPFGIDLRYVQVIIGVILGILLIYELFNKKIKLKFNKFILLIIVFYIYLFISNFMWIINDLPMNKSDFINMIILSFSNFLSICVFYFYKNHIDLKKVNTYIIISLSILLISMFMIRIGFSLSDIMGGPYTGYYAGNDNINFFGERIRYAGYAQDPNYASFFIWIAMISSNFYTENKIVKSLVIIFSILGICLSASKTIVIAIIFSVILIPILKIIKDRNPKFESKILNIGVITILSLPYIIVKGMYILDRTFKMGTMSTRLSMWKNAVNLFETSPILGSGITSFRSYFSIQPRGWYVHSHSTVFQLLSETGLLGFILFLIIILYLINMSNKYYKYVLSTFLIFSLTTELLHLSIFAFVIGLIPCILLNENEEGESVYQ